MADKEVGVFKKPYRVFDQNGGWVGSVIQRANDRVKVRGGGKEHRECLSMKRCYDILNVLKK
jgi:hypothetical protein